MAAEILATAMRRLPVGTMAASLPAEAHLPSEPGPPSEAGLPSLQQYDRNAPQGWRSRPVPVAERPPARTNQRYPNRTATRCSS
jgi:hypothetical protein